MQMVLESKELGIGPTVPQAIVADHVELLTYRNRFLDMPYTVSLHHQSPQRVSDT